MREFHVCPQRLLEDFPFEPANASIFLGQQLTSNVLIGGTLIIGGVLLSMLRTSTPEAQPQVTAPDNAVLD